MLLAGFVITGQPGSNRTGDKASPFYFGFDLRGTPQEDAKQYLPFLRYLGDTTGYHFKLRFTSRRKNTADEISHGNLDFAALGAVSYIQANENHSVKPLVRGLNNNSKAEYRSYIVVHPDSKITSLAELRNRKFAFGSKNSTQGHLIPRIELKKANITLDDFSSYEYMGSHASCADAVIRKRVDACGMQDTLAEELAKSGKLRVVFRSEYYPSSGIVANTGLSDLVIERVTNALIDFKPNEKHAEGLYNWERTEMPNGFTRAQANDYQVLREWLVDLGLIVKHAH